MYVIFQDKGADFPPIVTGVRSRREAVAFVLEEVASVKSHRMEPVAVDDARAWLARHDSFSMTEAQGSTYVWTLQRNRAWRRGRAGE